MQSVESKSNNIEVNPKDGREINGLWFVVAR